MKPPPLLPGDTIGVMAPSSYVEKADIEAAAKIMETLGYAVHIHPQTYARDRQSAGTAAQKTEALTELFSDPQIKAVWAAGGGNRALYLLDLLPYALIRTNPKAIIGFSDTTAILNAVYAKTGLTTFHGPVFRQLPQYGQMDHLLALLAGETRPLPFDGIKVLKPGRAEGPLIGGCLSIFQYLPGTEYMPDPAGKILLLEDTGDHISRIDRMILHLRRSGTFKKIAGLVVGAFTDMQDGKRPFGFLLEEILKENIEDIDIPVIMNAPIGHADVLYALPVGEEIRLDTANGLLSPA